jgi:hypothetical protein
MTRPRGRCVFTELLREGRHPTALAATELHNARARLGWAGQSCTVSPQRGENLSFIERAPRSPSHGTHSSPRSRSTGISGYRSRSHHRGGGLCGYLVFLQVEVRVGDVDELGTANRHGCSDGDGPKASTASSTDWECSPTRRPALRTGHGQVVHSDRVRAAQPGFHSSVHICGRLTRIRPITSPHSCGQECG